MRFENAAAMIRKLEGVLVRPTQVPSPAQLVALLSSYVVPIFQEIVQRSEETSVQLLQTDGLAQAAFVTARQTLAGELFDNIAEAAEELREALAGLALPEDHPAIRALDTIDGAVASYAEFLEEGEAEGDDGEAEDAVETGDVSSAPEAADAVTETPEAVEAPPVG